jgi:signal transduction histidine kinase
MLQFYHLIRAREKNVTLVYKVAKSFPQSLYTYLRRFERVADCLIGNAVRFSMQSSLIQIWLTYEPDNEMVEFSVVNKGYGMMDS